MYFLPLSMFSCSHICLNVKVLMQHDIPSLPQMHTGTQIQTETHAHVLSHPQSPQSHLPSHQSADTAASHRGSVWPPLWSRPLDTSPADSWWLRRGWTWAHQQGTVCKHGQLLEPYYQQQLHMIRSIEHALWMCSTNPGRLNLDYPSVTISSIKLVRPTYT